MEAGSVDSEANLRRSAAISRVLHDQARGGGSILWLAVDAPGENALPLTDALEERLAGGDARFVPLAHPAVDPRWRPRWLRLDTSASSGSLLLQDSIDHALGELSPESLRRGQGRRIAGWLRLDRDAPDAALVHLAGETIRRGPTGLRRLLRLHDPAVLWALWPLLGPERRRQMLGPVVSWSLLAPNGTLVRLESVVGEPGQAWDATLWQRVDAITPLNAALRDEEIAAHAMSDAQLERTRAMAMAALARAGDWGFDHPRDLCGFARHALTVHPFFDSHPTVARALQARAAGDHYLALVDDFSRDDWLEIGRSLTLAPVPETDTR